MNDIQWTEENREINGKVKEIMENDRATKDMEIRERIRQQILDSEQREQW